MANVFSPLLRCIKLQHCCSWKYCCCLSIKTLGKMLQYWVNYSEIKIHTQFVFIVSPATRPGRPTRSPDPVARLGRPTGPGPRPGRPTRSPDPVARLGRPTRPPDPVARLGRPTRSPDSVARPDPAPRPGRPTRSPDPVARLGRPTRPPDPVARLSRAPAEQLTEVPTLPLDTRESSIIAHQ